MSDQEPLTYESPMPFGKAHRGVKMANVPASYLMWFHDNVQGDMFTDPVHAYIDDNMDSIKQELIKQEYNEK